MHGGEHFMKTYPIISTSEGVLVRGLFLSAWLIIFYVWCERASGAFVSTESVAIQEVNTGGEYDGHQSRLKPQLPLSVTYELVESPTVGKPLHMTIKISSEIEFDALQVRVLPGRELLLLDASDTHNLGYLGKSKGRGFGVHLVPQKEGAHRIQLAFSLLRQGIGQSGVFTVPVVVGAKATQRVPELPLGAKEGTDENGRALLVFPAVSR